MERRKIHERPVDDWTSLKALVVNLEAWNVERDARLQAQVKKHAKATALIASLQRELKALREKKKAVIERAVQFAGNSCERHLDIVQRMGFCEFLEAHPSACSWCMATQVWALARIWTFLWKQFVENPGMDGGNDIQELGEKTRLLQRVPYDPETHGENVIADPGDLIYVLTDLGRSCLEKKDPRDFAVDHPS